MITQMRFNPYKTVPHWARFLTIDEFHFFLDVVGTELRVRSVLFQDNDGQLEVVGADGNITRCNLGKVALECGAVGIEGYANAVRLYFDRMLGKPKPPEPFPERFEEVQSIVRARIYTRDQVGEKLDNYIWRHLGGQLYVILAYDFPSTVASISPSHLERWKVSPDEAFRVGIANVRREKMKRDDFSLGAARCFCLMGNHGWAASYMLHIEKFLPKSSRGAIVGVPNRHMLVCYPIQLDTVMEALQELVPFISGLHHDPPDGDDRQNLTTDLFWCHEGKIDCIPAGMDLPGFPGSFIMPPEEFMNTVLADAAAASRKDKH